jgi:hypothetical protein
MSSVTSSFGQKSGRTAFLLAITATTNDEVGDNFPWNTAIRFSSSVVIPNSVLARSELVALANGSKALPVTLTQYVLYKDLGRQIVVFDDANGSLHRNVFRECLQVDNNQAEGVGTNPDNARIFIKVYSSYGDRVDVVRTG